MYQIPAEDFLEHYGIKGMKWGVRRYQNEDGSLTSAGKKRYGIFEKHQAKLEKEYLAKGYSEKGAAEKAEHKAKVHKALAIAGGVALTAAIGYGAYKYGMQATDSVVKAGKNLRRVAANDKSSIDVPFYATPNKFDNLKYRGWYGGIELGGAEGNDIYNKTMKVASDIKVAGGRSGQKIINEAFSKDPKLANEYANAVGFYFSPKLGENIKNGKIGRKEYEAINRAFVVHDNIAPGIDACHKKVYDSFKKAGYDAVKDINDMKYSGYRAKMPLIVFNGNKATMSSVKKLSQSQIDKDLKLAGAAIYGPPVAKTLGIYGGLGAGLGMLSSASAERSNDRMVANYKKQHPQTEMTYEEILESLRGMRSSELRRYQ